MFSSSEVELFYSAISSYLTVDYIGCNCISYFSLFELFSISAFSPSFLLPVIGGTTALALF